MTIQKDGRVYTVVDKGAQWCVTRDLGGVKAEYCIEKDLAPNADALEAYIIEHDDLF